MNYRKIHYCWFGPNDLSELATQCIDTWKKYFPDHEIICWSESNIPISNDITNYYIKRKMWAFLSDYIRLVVLHQYGGIYFDTDIEVIKSFPEFIKNEAIFGWESDDFINAGVIISPPQNKFIKFCIDDIEERFKSKRYFETIPRTITRCFEEFNEKYLVRITDKETFYPFNPYTDSKKILMFKDIKNNTLCIHHWEHNWNISKIDRLKNKLKRMMKT